MQAYVVGTHPHFIVKLLQAVYLCIAMELSFNKAMLSNAALHRAQVLSRASPPQMLAQILASPAQMCKLMTASS